MISRGKPTSNNWSEHHEEYCYSTCKYFHERPEGYARITAIHAPVSANRPLIRPQQAAETTEYTGLGAKHLLHINHVTSWLPRRHDFYKSICAVNARIDRTIEAMLCTSNRADNSESVVHIVVRITPTRQYRATWKLDTCIRGLFELSSDRCNRETIRQRRQILIEWRSRGERWSALAVVNSEDNDVHNSTDVAAGVMWDMVQQYRVADGRLTDVYQGTPSTYNGVLQSSRCMVARTCINRYNYKISRVAFVVSFFCRVHLLYIISSHEPWVQTPLR